MLETGLALHPSVVDFYREELAALRHAGVPPDRAGLAAARAAALFAQGDALNDLSELSMDATPSPQALARIATHLALSATPAGIAVIRRHWHNLGTTESLMETGGDIRLARDPVSALNGYGCSHRPRPWAITFASSTASSSSERGYAAANAARRRVTATLLNGEPAPVLAALEDVRNSLARMYGLAPGGAVVLAASGTDTELLALALTHLATPARPILNILIAPEETGSGVPMAATGRHFAVDTALGHDVARAAPIEGFAADTILHNIPVRGAPGIRAAAAVEADIAKAVAAGIAAGKRVLLHVLDLSKTGLLAPSLVFLHHLRADHGTGALDLVVDACQARLSPASVQAYLALDAAVLITGSKFFTGPPFAGAVLLPPAIAARFAGRKLPAGLAAYFNQGEFPAACAAAAALPAGGNYGLALRWHAALAEMRALFAVPLLVRAHILRRFANIVRERIAADPRFVLLPAPAIRRHEDAESWENLPSIFTFSLSLTVGGLPLTLDQARAVYRWLNADLTAALPGLDTAARHLCHVICHIGQPVKLSLGSATLGALRVSAGARLLAGEPSHGGLDAAGRLRREFADVKTVFEKIALILTHFSKLEQIDPQPCYK